MSVIRRAFDFDAEVKTQSALIPGRAGQSVQVWGWVMAVDGAKDVSLTTSDTSIDVFTYYFRAGEYVYVNTRPHFPVFEAPLGEGVDITTNNNRPLSLIIFYNYSKD